MKTMQNYSTILQTMKNHETIVCYNFVLLGYNGGFHHVNTFTYSLMNWNEWLGLLVVLP